MAVPIIRQAELGLSTRGLHRLVAVGILVVLGVGAVVGLSNGIGGAAIAVGLAGAIVITITYIHRPFWVVMGFWFFLLLQDTIAAALGKGGGAGGLVAKAENPMIAPA